MPHRSRLPHGAAAPDHLGAVASLAAGKPITTLLAEDPAARAAALDAVLTKAADAQTRVIRVGNPLRAPLTLERLLIQSVGSHAGLYVDDDPARITRLIACPEADEGRVLVAIDQADTLHPDAVRALHRMSAHFNDQLPRLQIVLAGTSNLPLLLENPVAVRFGTEMLAVVPAPPVPAGLRAAVPPRRRWIRVAAGSAVVTAVAASAALVLQQNPWPQTAGMGQAAVAAPPRPDPMIRLRRNFDEFLAASGQNTARLTEAQRQALFNEYLQWRTNAQPVAR